MYHPTVSVIVNTYNRGPHLRRLLDALSRQSYDNFEVIVVNGPSTDNTKEVIREYRKAIKTAKCPAVNLSSSRNIGIRKAAGEIIAFIDDDAVPRDVHWMENAVGLFRDEKVGIAAGTVYDLGDQIRFRYGWFDIWGRNIGVQDKAVIYDDPKGERFSCGQGCNVFFRTDAAAKAGGFDEYFVYHLDESDLGMRIIQRGYTCRYGEHMDVLHEAASGPFRKKEYHEDWNVIGRSHGYFVLKATENTGKTREERAEAARQSAESRVQALQNRRDHQLITQEECAELIGALRNGIEQGIRDSEKARKLASFTRTGRTKFRKFDKTLSGGHQHFCILCDSLKEDIPERIRAQMKSLSGRGDHVYAIVKGERTRLELRDGVNYCMTDTGDPKGLQTTPFRESPAFLRVVRNLKQSFGVNMVTTPIQDLLSYTVGCFSPEHLFTTGDADKTESAIRLRKSGIQYGPYITLRKGIYEVVYSGNHLQKIDDYHVTSDAGKRVIHHNLTEKTDHTVRYSFSIDEETTNIEFAASNQQEEPVEITGIELKQFRG